MDLHLDDFVQGYERITRVDDRLFESIPKGNEKKYIDALVLRFLEIQNYRGLQSLADYVEKKESEGLTNYILANVYPNLGSQIRNFIGKTQRNFKSKENARTRVKKL
jgi:hypothetical protein